MDLEQTGNISLKNLHHKIFTINVPVSEESHYFTTAIFITVNKTFPKMSKSQNVKSAFQFDAVTIPSVYIKKC